MELTHTLALYFLVSFPPPLSSYLSSYLGISRKRSSTHDVESDDDQFVVYTKKTKISNIGKNLLTILLVMLVEGPE